VRLKDNKFDPLEKGRSGISAMPGVYKVSAEMVVRGESTPVGNPVTFNTLALNNSSIPPANKSELLSFQQKVSAIEGVLTGLTREIESSLTEIAQIRQTLSNSHVADPELKNSAQKLETSLKDLQYKIKGPEAKASQEELPPMLMSAEQRLGFLSESSLSSTSAITQTQQEALRILQKQVPGFRDALSELKTGMEQLRDEMNAKGMPWTPGRVL